MDLNTQVEMERSRILIEQAKEAIRNSQRLKECRLDHISNRIRTRMQTLRRQGLQP